MPHGVIIKGIGGFYYIKSGNEIIECKARGRFRNEGVIPLVGDVVDYSAKDNSYVIDNIMPRKNSLIRPPVANVDQAILVFASAKPEPNLDLLNRFLILIEHNNLHAVICINKSDLTDNGIVNNIMTPYKDAGYRVIYTSTVLNIGIDELKTCLKDKINVFAGPSGVGKSSLLNALQPGFNLKTGDLSDKLDRGKHTTRHSELLGLCSGGFVADTPGFSSLEIDFISKEELENLFPEFRDLNNPCRFARCSHITEPDCAVKAAVSNRIINKERYNSYVSLYNELSRVRRKYK